MDQARKDQLMALQGCIILLKKPNDDSYYGWVENSFSMSIEKNRTYFYWSGPAFFGKTQVGVRNGRELAETSVKKLQKDYPDWTFEVYDAHDTEKLPVVINWDLWLDAKQPNPDAFSGVKNKHEARNVRFHLKDEVCAQKKEAEKLVCTIKVVC